MVVQELKRAECLAVLRGNHIGRLGFARFNQPYIVPIYFSFDADRACLYGFSTIGDKVQCMRRNPRVCLEVDEIVDGNHWSSVLAVGRYREIHRNPRDAEARRRAEQLLQERDEWWLPGIAKTGGAEHAQAVIFRISIDHLTGRRAARNGRHSPALAPSA